MISVVHNDGDMRSGRLLENRCCTENVTLGIDGNGLSMNGICDRSSLVKTIIIQSSSFILIDHSQLE